METTKPFPVALRELVIDNDFVTLGGKPNWAAFATEVKGCAAPGRHRPAPADPRADRRVRAGAQASS